jgi:hypothetical protein
MINILLCDPWNTQEKVSRAIQNIAYFVMQAGHTPRDGAGLELVPAAGFL